MTGLVGTDSNDRPRSEIPGSPENFTMLLRYLDGWKCCGAPYLCGAPCQDDELSATLAAAQRLVRDAHKVAS